MKIDPPSEKKPDLLNQYERLTEHAHRQIDRAWKAYGILGTLITILFAVAAILLNRSVSEIRKDMQDRATGLFDLTQKQVSDRVDAAFKQDKIQDLVEKKAEARIDVVADAIISNHVHRTVDPLVADVESRLSSISSDISSAKEELRSLDASSSNRMAAIDNTLAEAKSALQELRTTSLFSMTVTAAQSDDRNAFDQLKAWAHDPAFPFSKEADAAWMKIYTEASMFSVWTPNSVPWSAGVDPSSFDLATLREAYLSCPPFAKTSMLKYIWERTDIPHRDRLQFLIDVIRDDANLRAVVYAAKYFSEDTTNTFGTIQFIDPLVSWWESNKDNIK